MSKIINISSKKNKLQSKKMGSNFRGKNKMNSINIKPIMATPQLSGQDVENIVASIAKKPSNELVERNRRLSSKFKKR